jgi:hypothetical protein
VLDYSSGHGINVPLGRRSYRVFICKARNTSSSPRPIYLNGCPCSHKDPRLSHPLSPGRSMVCVCVCMHSCVFSPAFPIICPPSLPYPSPASPAFPSLSRLQPQYQSAWSEVEPSAFPPPTCTLPRMNPTLCSDSQGAPPPRSPALLPMHHDSDQKQPLWALSFR